MSRMRGSKYGPDMPSRTEDPNAYQREWRKRNPNWKRPDPRRDAAYKQAERRLRKRHSFEFKELYDEALEEMGLAG